MILVSHGYCSLYMNVMMSAEAEAKNLMEGYGPDSPK
jgi:hypothetical protein